MKKCLIIAAAVIIVLASVFMIVRARSTKGLDFFDANVEALSDDEYGDPVTIPCVQSGSSCDFILFDALGNPYSVSIPGFSHV